MSYSIVFMGTPQFAVPSLKALVNAGHDVRAVVCQPDRPRGRSGKPAPCEVKTAALELGLEVLQYESVRKQCALDALRALAPDLFVTAAFGQILSTKVLGIPRLGTINVHASLLPRYRGPAPINRCIIAGDSEAGVTTMYTERGVDTGDMLLQRSIEILPCETAGELTLRLADLGADALVATLDQLAAGTLVPRKQDEALATYQSMLQKEDGLINWNTDARSVVNLIHGVNPWPGAFTTSEIGTIKLWRAKLADQECASAQSRPGTVIAADKAHGLVIQCGTGAISVDEIQMPGAKRLSARDFLNGKSIAVGTLLGQEAQNG